MAEREGGGSNAVVIIVGVLAVVIVAPILLAVCVGFGSIAGLTILGNSLDNKFEEVSDGLDGAG